MQYKEKDEGNDVLLSFFTLLRCDEAETATWASRGCIRSPFLDQPDGPL